jgi:hypothetical protein
MRGQQIPVAQLFIVALASISAAVAVVGTWRMARGGDRPRGEAGLWLSWSPQEREAYVWGYLHGYDAGKHLACSFYGERMEAYTHERVPIERTPRAVCLDALPQYPQPHSQVYVDAITSYFTKHPSDREAGMESIMMELASPPGLTIDQIHAKLTGR